MKVLKLIVASLAVLSWHTLSGQDGESFLSGLIASAQGPCPLRGSCNLEPVLQGRTDLLLFEDFERTDWQSAWSDISFPQNVSGISSPVFAGSRALEVRIPTGAHDGASLDFRFGNVGVADPEEIYFRITFGSTTRGSEAAMARWASCQGSTRRTEPTPGTAARPRTAPTGGARG